MDPRSMNRRPLATSSQYAVALASVAVATWLRMLLDPLLGDHLPFVTFFVAVMVASWFGGVGSSIAALLLGCASAMYFFIPPRHSFAISGMANVVGLFLYFFVGISSIVLIQVRHAAQRRAETSEEKFRRLNAGLELRVQERTVDLQKAKETLEAEVRLKAFAADVGAALTEPALLKDSLHRCAEAMVRHLDAAFARIWVLNQEQNVLELRASAGLYTNLEGAHARVPVGQFKIGLIAQERQPHLTNNVIGDPRVPQQEWAKREGMVAFAGYPLLLEDRVVGVMGMFARKPLTEAVLNAMQMVTYGLALVIERKRAEALLLQTQERLQLALKAGNAGLWSWNLKTNEVHISPTWKAQLGYADEEIPDRYEEFESRLHPDDRDRVRQRNTAFIENPSSDYEIEFRLRHKDGSYRWVMTRADVYKDTDGQSTWLTGCNIDITERKQMEAQAARLERLAATGQLLGGVAHEFKNPLFILTGHLQLLKEKITNRNAGDLAGDFQKVLEAAKRLSLITDQFLSLSGPAASRQERCSVQAVLQKTLDFLGHELTRNRIRVVTTYAPDLPDIQADPAQLREVFQNLILNAMQAMSEAYGKGTLTVSAALVTDAETRRQGDAESAASEEGGRGEGMTRGQGEGKNWIEVRIQDDGPGIPPELRTKIFEPFFTTKSPDKATGLGLWIVRSNLMILRGAVQMETNIGQGTTFTVKLPTVAESPVSSKQQGV